MRHFKTLTVIILAPVMLASCYNMGGQPPPRREGMGQYQRPLYLQPQPTRRMPNADLCRSQLYLGLVGQHEGGILFASLPGRTRVVKPATLELDQDDFLEDMRPQPPYVVVREYLSGQAIYAPSISPINLVDGLGPIENDRLTIMLDPYGYVEEVSCR